MTVDKSVSLTSITVMLRAEHNAGMSGRRGRGSEEEELSKQDQFSESLKNADP